MRTSICGNRTKYKIVFMTDYFMFRLGRILKVGWQFSSLRVFTFTARAAKMLLLTKAARKSVNSPGLNLLVG